MRKSGPRQKDEWRGRWKEKIYEICWRWDREGGEVAAACLAQSSGQDWGIGFGGEEGEVKIYREPACFHRQSGHWDSRECLAVDVG